MQGSGISHIVALVALVPWCAFVHRLRGGGFVKMPVKGTYVLWPLIGLAAWVAGSSPIAAAIWAFGYLLWIVPGWMDEILGAEGVKVPPDQVVGLGWDVWLVEWMTGYNIVLAVYVRAGLYLIPLAVGLGVYAARSGESLTPEWALAFIVLGFWPCYRLGWYLRASDQSSVAEPAVGGSWGLAILVCVVAGIR